MIEIENFGRIGTVSGDSGVFTFQIGSSTDTDGVISFSDLPILRTPPVLNFARYKIYLMGYDNNLPGEIKEMIGGNRVLPQLIEKQVTALYGQGPMVYLLIYQDKKPVRQWEPNDQIQDWLNSWQGIGMRDGFDSSAP